MREYSPRRRPHRTVRNQHHPEAQGEYSACRREAGQALRDVCVSTPPAYNPPCWQRERAGTAERSPADLPDSLSPLAFAGFGRVLVMVVLAKVSDHNCGIPLGSCLRCRGRLDGSHFLRRRPKAVPKFNKSREPAPLSTCWY